LPDQRTAAVTRISGLFLLSGLAAVFGTPGLIFAIVMSVVEAIWIPAAAIAFARGQTRKRTRPAVLEMSW
jgi:hypothetical protein